VMLSTTLTLTGLLFFAKVIGRRTGAAMIAAYGVYMAALFV
jgi:hypothetical protein